MAYNFIEGQRRSNLSQDPSKEKVNYQESLRTKLTMDPKAMFLQTPPISTGNQPPSSVPSNPPDPSIFVKINGLFWTIKNMDITTYRDGTPIPQVTDQTQWVGLTTGAWCWYNNNSGYDATYGKLYNWYAVAGIYDASSFSNPTLRKNFAPTGYRVPTRTEWQNLRDYVGGDATSLLSISAGGTNTTGFSAIYPGYRAETGTFDKIGAWTEWWGSTEDTIDPAFANNVYIDGGSSHMVNDIWYKIDGSSVRLLFD
jgi:uncharacterized protein (TIGR02145 family)